VSHRGDQIVAALGDGAGLGVHIEYSPEPLALETAGGIAVALPLLGTGPFIAVNADIYCDFDFVKLAGRLAWMKRKDARAWAHLVLVDNPEHHRKGDFALGADGAIRTEAAPRLTFSGIGVYRQELFAGIVPGERKALGPLLHAAADQGRVYGERHDGLWMDIGTPERLSLLREFLSGPDEQAARA
jgi:MurNAc alpha-1-phosphate uridylyltransferase